MSSKPAIAILGVVRNGGRELSETLGQVCQLRRRIHRSACIIATNDNSDETDSLLCDFAGSDHNTHILRLDGLVQSHPKRAERIALARNMTLATMWDKCTLPYTLIIDMDGPNTRLPVDRILSALQTAGSGSWDALFANQVTSYYDIYALRHPVWCSRDAWQEIKRWRRHSLGLFPRKWLVSKLVHDRQYSIPSTNPLIPVGSAFGGLGLYRTASMRGAWYGARDALGNIICEHVALHNAMVSNGKRLFIDPAMINIAPSGHLGTTSGRPYPEFDAE